MARTTFIDIPPGQEDIYWDAVQTGDRFTIPRVLRKLCDNPIGRHVVISGRSLLPQISVIWAGFDAPTKLNWKNAGAEMGVNGWQAFVADQTIRILGGLAGEATPSIFHQDMIGRLLISAPAEEIHIAQYHPSEYKVYQKVTGKQKMYAPVSVTELLTLPLTLTINYKSNLVSTGGGSFARFYAIVRHLYQGVNRTTNLVINIPLIGGWATLTEQVTALIGIAVSYDLYIHLFKVTGTLLFDNLKAEHSAQNWVQDPFCREIDKTFKSSFYQIPNYWNPINVPANTSYESVYPV